MTVLTTKFHSLPLGNSTSAYSASEFVLVDMSSGSAVDVRFPYSTLLTALDILYLNAASNLSDLANVATARTNLGAGSASGLATLDSGGKVPTAQLPTTVVNGLHFVGGWDANANSPTLTSGAGTIGALYKVTTAGTTTLDGISQWNAGDELFFDGTVWDKIDGIANEVISVAGRTGAVTLSNTDISGLGALATLSVVTESRLSLTTTTTANATTSQHGLLPTLSGVATQFLNGNGGWSVPLSTPVSVANGGSGTSTLTIHGLMVGQGTSAVGLVAPGTSGLPLVAQGASADPIYTTLTESALTLADVVTLDVSTSKHGLVPKAPNDTTKFLRGDATWNTAVTSVALSASGVSWFSITGSPITTTGTLTIGLASGLTANQFLGTPNGSTGTVSLRSLVAADLPVFVASGASHTKGAVPDPGASAGTTKFLCEDATFKVITEQLITLANTTTLNATTSRHGFLPILPNDITKYLDGTGAWATITSSAGGSSGQAQFNSSGSLAGSAYITLVGGGVDIANNATGSSASSAIGTNSGAGNQITYISKADVGTAYAIIGLGNATATFTATNIGEANHAGSTTSVSIGSGAGTHAVSINSLLYPSVDGTNGQFLKTNGSGVLSWGTAGGGSSPLTTKGDLYVYSTTDDRLAVGTDTYVLTANSADPTGMSWSPAGTPSLPIVTISDPTTIIENVSALSIFATDASGNPVITGYVSGTVAAGTATIDANGNFVLTGWTGSTTGGTYGFNSSGNGALTSIETIIGVASGNISLAPGTSGTLLLGNAASGTTTILTGGNGKLVIYGGNSAANTFVNSGAITGGFLGVKFYKLSSDVSNVTTTETILATNTLAAGTLGTNGDHVAYSLSGVMSNTLTTKDLRLKVGGTTVLDTGALSITGASAFIAQLKVERLNATSVLASGVITVSGLATPISTAFVQKVTGLTLSSTLNNQLTGQGGATSANGEITLNGGDGIFWPVA